MTAQLGLEFETLPASVRAILDDLAGRHADEIRALAPIVWEVGRKAYPEPFAMANVRIVAECRGVLPKSEGRTLSWLGAVPKVLGLRSAGRGRRSGIPAAHGNWQSLWFLP